MILTLILGAAGVGAALRWLRVAQQEHYLAGSTTRFAWRWWRSSKTNVGLGLLSALALLGVWWRPVIGWLGLAALAGPLGLAWRGRSSPLALTGRLRRLAMTTFVLIVAVVLAALRYRRPGLAVPLPILAPLLIDLALGLLGPIEKRLGEKWVERAKVKLAASGARVVAITGSFGKTTTKAYVAHLLSVRYATVQSPASFNNRMGLARAINEQLNPGTEVFVAEMGTYAQGEIAELCRFVPPEVGVITGIGPVHLERFGSEGAIVAAKREILVGTRLAVVNVDHPLLAGLADDVVAERSVVRCSGLDPGADVAVSGGKILVAGDVVGEVAGHVFASNLACAVAVALYFGIEREHIAARVNSLPAVAHRRQVSSAPGGFVIIDDTYNSNPAGAAAALVVLSQLGDGRKVLVTPGMVELGDRQYEENRVFAATAAGLVSDLVVVGLTNRPALLEGAAGGGAAVTVVRSRDEAVEWVRSHLGPGDAVLYENDLPDHYP